MSWHLSIAILLIAAGLGLALGAAITPRPRPPIRPPALRTLPLPPVPRVVGAAVPGARALEVSWDAKRACWCCTGTYAHAIPEQFFAQAGYQMRACDATLGDDDVRVWCEHKRLWAPLVDGECGWVETRGA